VQELMHNKGQSAAGRNRMLALIRSSATCLLNTISGALSVSGSVNGAAPGGAAGGGGSAAGGGARALPAAGSLPRRQHKVQLWRVAESVVRLSRPLVRDGVVLLNCVSRDLEVRGDSARLMQVRALEGAGWAKGVGCVRWC
jgi:hypothetical protein